MIEFSSTLKSIQLTRINEERRAHEKSILLAMLDQNEIKQSQDEVSFSVNGETRSVEAHPMERLLDVLREQLHLTGTKEGCGEGECGACTVIIDGRIVNSCLVPVAQVEGATIKTIEGVASGEPVARSAAGVHRLRRRAVWHLHAGDGDGRGDLLERNPNPTEAEIRNGLAGNLCRCTGYMKIFDSVVRACQKQA